jgi:hypothetical protein
MTTAGVRPIRPEDSPSPVTIVGDRLEIRHLTVSDPEAVRLVATAPESEQAEILQRIIAVGARGLTTMGIGIDVANIDDRVRTVVIAATDEAQATIASILESGRRSLSEQFDPDQRTSILARALADFTQWRDGFLRTLDPAVEGSVTTVLVDRLQSLIGPDGALERRLAEALDLDTDGSSFARLNATIEERFAELRRDIARTQGADDARAEEAERGTAHGLVFEDVVEGHLRGWASHVKGTIVERTATSAGGLASTARVGDFVVTLPSGHRIVVEVKRQATITLTGPDGILAELDKAITNRSADAAICVSGRDAYPAEVGAFNVYGDRVLVVDEGDGALTAVALQWAMVSLAARLGTGAELDATAVADRIDRIRKGAESLSGARRSITGIRASLDKLHEMLGDLRGDLLDQVDDLDRLVLTAESRGGSDPHS